MAETATKPARAPHRVGVSTFFSPGLSFRQSWKTITYLLALVSFGALFITKELHPITSVVFVGFWLAGYKLNRAPEWFKPWMQSALTFLALGAITLILRTQFFQAVLNLLLFLVLNKLFTLRRSRDFLQAELLCFFVILSTAVITVSFYFLFFFLLYSLLSVLGLAFYGIGRQMELSGLDGLSDSRPAPPPPRISFWGGIITLISLALVVAYFFLIPHVSGEPLSAPMSRQNIQSQDQLTGFSEDLTFGQFKQLVPDQTVVMRVEMSWPPGGGSQRPPNLMLRGLSLDYYDEKGWKRSPDRRDLPVFPQRKINIRVPTTLRGSITNLTVYQNPEVTMRAFTAPFPTEVDLLADRHIRYDSEALGIQVVAVGTSRDNTYTNPFTYRVSCNLVNESSEFLPDLIRAQKRRREILSGALNLFHDHDQRGRYWADLKRQARQNLGVTPWTNLGRPVPLGAKDRLDNLQMPNSAMSRRLRELSLREIPGPSTAEIAWQTASYLRRNYKYSLIPETPPGMHPLEAFMFTTHKGHCEFFASALTLMLRSRGIPARIVNGFHTSDWNDLAEVFVVKQSDAHSWVEAWLDEVGWVVVDATPPGSIGRAAYGEFKPSVLGQLNDYFRIQWQRLVIDYSADKQVALKTKLGSLPGLRLFTRGFNEFREFVSGQKARADSDTPPRTTREKLRYYGGWLLDVITIGLIVTGLRRIYLLLPSQRRRRARRSGIDFFDAALERLEHAGLRRRAAQTPAELVHQAIASGWDAGALGRLLDLYHVTRFSGRPLPAPERREARRLAQSLRPPEPQRM